jgi:NAD(P)-dependent dehydrogenase (short-subunit alcohol dehydrogenase family)
MRALVTGGMSGIGAAVVARLKTAGHDVVIWDQTDGADHVLDVSDPGAVDAAMAAVLETGPVPKIVVISAGIGHGGMIVDITPADWDRVIGVNLTGSWLTVKASATAMIAAKTGGSIVVVTSISGTVVDRMMAAYCVSKAGADMLVKVAAAEFGVHGIRVNGIGPGATNTPLLSDAAALPGWVDGLTERTALGRIGEPDDVAQAVVALVDLDWVTGQILFADGGLALHSPLDAFGQLQRTYRSSDG